jgi:hypothetical protein
MIILCPQFAFVLNMADTPQQTALEAEAGIECGVKFIDIF